MNNQQRFLFGAATAAAVVFAGSRAVRGRHAIDFAGRVAVITGGSRGLGLVIARQLAAQGARICLLARDEAELGRAREELLFAADERDGRTAESAAAAGDAVMTIRCDIRRRTDVRAAVGQALERWSA